MGAAPVTPIGAAGSGARPGNFTVLPGQTPAGEYILSVLLKRSYRFAHGMTCVRTEKDRKIISGDQHYQDPMNSSVRHESDFVPFKLATDVVLNCQVYAPDGKAVAELVATVMVGEQRKGIYVIGDRLAKHRPDATPLFTDPQPFTVMPVRYEHAYGGVDIYSDRKMHCIYARNHLGKGFAIANIKEVVEDLPLPNIEDLDDRLQPERLCAGHFMYWERQPMPEGLGWFAQHWQPRCLLAGVMPADKKYEIELRAAYAQLIPAEQREMYAQTQLPNMDFRFFNGASRGLVLPYLKGDELIRTRHLVPEGVMGFQLPGEQPRIGVDIGSGVQEPPVVLQTVMVHMDEREVDLVWRAALPYPGPDWLPQMRTLEVSIQ
jgi:hypothetical protein